MKNSLVALLAVGLLGSTTSCSDKKNEAKAPQLPNEPLYSIGLELNDRDPSKTYIKQNYSAASVRFALNVIDEKNDLYKKYEQAKIISMEEIVELMVKDHLAHNPFSIYNNDYRKFKNILSEISRQAKKGASSKLENFKSEYESIIETDYNNDLPLIYNKDYDTLDSPVEYGRVQCYSGTTLFYSLLFSKSKGAMKDVDEVRMVVILQDAHILPGYVENGKLYGIESTAGGDAIIDFGKTKEISGRISVYNAKQFLFAELFKWRISNFAALQSQMDKYSTETYGFKKGSLQKPDSVKGLVSNSGEFNYPKISVTPFNFGVSNALPGDTKREFFNRKDQSRLYTLNKCPKGAKCITVQERNKMREYDEYKRRQPHSYRTLKKYFAEKHNVVVNCTKRDGLSKRTKEKMGRGLMRSDCTQFMKMLYDEFEGRHSYFNNYDGKYYEHVPNDFDKVELVLDFNPESHRAMDIRDNKKQRRREVYFNLAYDDVPLSSLARVLKGQGSHSEYGYFEYDLPRYKDRGYRD